MSKNYTPSALRRRGRMAYWGGATLEDAHYANPWTNDDGTLIRSFYALSNARDFMDGWNEARQEWEKEQKILDDTSGVRDNGQELYAENERLKRELRVSLDALADATNMIHRLEGVCEKVAFTIERGWQDNAQIQRHVKNIRSAVADAERLEERPLHPMERKAMHSALRKSARIIGKAYSEEDITAIRREQMEKDAEKCAEIQKAASVRWADRCEKYWEGRRDGANLCKVSIQESIMAQEDE